MKFVCFVGFLTAFAVIMPLSAVADLTIDSPAEVILDSTSAITVTGSITGTGILACPDMAEVYVSGDWGISTFSPGNSTVYFDDATQIISLSTNNAFYNLVIVGSASITDISTAGLAVTNALTISQYATLTLGNGFEHTLPLNTTVDGAFDMGLSDLVCNGDLTIGATGILSMNAQSASSRPRIMMADTKALTINGQLSTSWASGNLKSVITSTTIGARYGFAVNGKISANGLIIASTDANGLTINSGADRTCDLDNVDFQDVATDGRHLYIGFISGSYLGNYDNCSFDNSFGAGNNVGCANTAGSTVLWFTKWSGSGGGDSYKSEGTNTQIIWVIADTMTASPDAAVILESTSAITVPGDFNVPVVTCTGASSIYVKGEWGVITFTPGASTVHFNGGTQTIAMGSGTTSFYGISVDSTDGQTSGVPLVIAPNGAIQVSGNYNVSNNTITLGSSASVQVSANGLLNADNVSFTTVNPGTDRFNFAVGSGGNLDLNNCHITSTTTAGLNIQTGAAITNLKDTKFYSHPGGTDGRFISVAVDNLNKECDGCWFDTITTGYNVSASGTALIIRFSTYGAGPGAGKSKTYDDDLDGDGVANTGGAVVLWLSQSTQMVSSDAPAGSGAIQGFATPAFDLNTFAFYSTYVTARNINGANSADRIVTLDANGAIKYYYEVAQKYGDIVLTPWWYTEGTTHTVYFGTSAGYLFRLVDTGSALVLSPSWTLKVCTEVTSAVISDGINLYFGGLENTTPKIYGYMIASQERIFGLTVASRITATPSWAINSGTTYLFAGSDMPTPLLYRINVSSRVIDKQNSSPSGSVHAPPVYWEWMGLSVLFAGDYGGRMNGVDPFSTEFTSLAGFPRDNAALSITAMAYVNLLGGPNFRLVYADMGGWLYDRNQDGTLYNPGSGAYPIQLGGGVPIESAPLCGTSLIYVGNNDGKVFAINESTRSVSQTYSFGSGIKIGDIARDFDSNLILVPTNQGRVYYIND